MKALVRVVVGGVLALGAVALAVPANASPATSETVAAVAAPSAAEASKEIVLIDKAAAVAAAASAPLPAGTTFATDGGGVNAKAVCSYGGDHPNLFQGVTGKSTQVKHLQCLLKNFYGATYLAQDGICGAQTKLVVESFQRSHKIQVDGWVGANTWNHLHPDSDAGFSH